MVSGAVTLRYNTCCFGIVIVYYMKGPSLIPGRVKYGAQRNAAGSIITSTDFYPGFNGTRLRFVFTARNRL